MSVRLKASDRISLCEQYHGCLEKCVKQGDSALVCQDHALHKSVQNLLSEGDVQVLFSSMGLDPLAIMEASLQSTGPGLEGLAKAFEVLELAALNLYLCPWRKEYRTIKMFSGTYIHQVAPVLSEKQAAVLFGLLGYRVVEGRIRGQQLELRRQPSAEQLRQLACAFFFARCECCLLLAAMGSPDGGLVFQQALVKERQKGRGVQEALSNVWKQMGVRKQDTPLEGDVDLYTADANNVESQSDMPQEQTKHVCAMNLYNSGSTLPAGGSSSISVQDKAVSATTSGKTKMSGAGTGQQIAFQANISDWRAADSSAVSQEGRKSPVTMYCEPCCIVHKLICPELEHCERQRHRTHFVEKNTIHQERASGVQEPKKQEKLVLRLKRHTCLEEGRSSAHDPMCEQGIKSEQAVLFKGSPEPSEHATPLSLTSHSPALHSCDPGRFTTGVVHNISYSDMKFCMHLQQDAIKCTDTKDCMVPIRAVCEHCHCAYCKICWFKCPLTCECGQSLSIVK